jgi:phage replication-related protein YjqB (UPF0714/DUF867 family)
MPTDSFRSFEELSAVFHEGYDFAVRAVPRASTYAIVAPHGGKIEPGTSELALAVAGEEYSLYMFEGLMERSWALHIPSEAFDERRCLEILGAATTVITIHGMAGNGREVRLGGLDESLLERLAAKLMAADFTARQADDTSIAGRHPNNLCNRGRSGRGCQLEISRGLRETMFRTNTPCGRAESTAKFRKFVGAVRSVLE